MLHWIERKIFYPVLLRTYRAAASAIDRIEAGIVADAERTHGAWMRTGPAGRARRRGDPAVDAEA